CTIGASKSGAPSSPMSIHGRPQPADDTSSQPFVSNPNRTRPATTQVAAPTISHGVRRHLLQASSSVRPVMAAVRNWAESRNPSSDHGSWPIFITMAQHQQATPSASSVVQRRIQPTRSVPRSVIGTHSTHRRSQRHHRGKPNPSDVQHKSTENP
ncbi:hypothetical protein ACLOJK_023979, partial [Asimina triloba]